MSPWCVRYTKSCDVRVDFCWSSLIRRVWLPNLGYIWRANHDSGEYISGSGEHTFDFINAGWHADLSPVFLLTWSTDDVAKSSSVFIDSFDDVSYWRNNTYNNTPVNTSSRVNDLVCQYVCLYEQYLYSHLSSQRLSWIISLLFVSTTCSKRLADSSCGSFRF